MSEHFKEIRDWYNKSHPDKSAIDDFEVIQLKEYWKYCLDSLNDLQSYNVYEEIVKVDIEAGSVRQYLKGEHFNIKEDVDEKSFFKFFLNCRAELIIIENSQDLFIKLQETKDEINNFLGSYSNQREVKNISYKFKKGNQKQIKSKLITNYFITDSFHKIQNLEKELKALIVVLDAIFQEISISDIICIKGYDKYTSSLKNLYGMRLANDYDKLFDYSSLQDVIKTFSSFFRLLNFYDSEKMKKDKPYFDDEVHNNILRKIGFKDYHKFFPRISTSK